MDFHQLLQNFTLLTPIAPSLLKKSISRITAQAIALTSLPSTRCESSQRLKIECSYLPFTPQYYPPAMISAYCFNFKLGYEIYAVKGIFLFMWTCFI